MNLKQLLDTLQAAYEGSTQGTWGKGMTTHHTVSDGCGYNRYPIAEFHHAADADFCDVAHEVAPLIVARTTGLQVQLDALRKDSGALRAGLVCSKADSVTPLTFASTPEAVKGYEDEGFHVVHLFARLPAECKLFGYWFERERRFATLEEAERYFDESERLELLVALYTTPQPCPEIYSKDVMNRIQTICEQSLTPEIYDKWVEVSEALYKTRRDLK